MELTEEQKMILDMVKEFAETKIKPRASEVDEEGEFPWDIFEAAKDLGLIGMAVPEEYQGMGCDLTTLCLVVEEIAKVCASSSLMIAAQELGVVPLLLGGSEEQKQKFLPKCASGDWIAAFCLTEPEAGSDAGAIQTTAERQDDHYVLNGTKHFITNGGIADLYTVIAKTNPDAGIRGMSAFAVKGDNPGLKQGKKEHKMGIRGSQTTEVIFDDCRVPVDQRLGSEGAGFRLAMDTLNRTRPGVGAQALGIAEGAFDFAVDYIKQRKQFGQRIADFQGIQFKVADLAADIEAARGLVYRAASLIEEAGDKPLRGEAVKISAMSKMYASDVAMRVTTEAVQLAGGYGYMKEYPLERMMRDAKITQIYEGTNEIQRTVIARNVIRGR